MKTCKNCTERKINCHSTCDIYKEFKKYIDAIRNKERNEKVSAWNAKNNSWSYTRKRKR